GGGGARGGPRPPAGEPSRFVEDVDEDARLGGPPASATARGPGDLRRRICPNRGRAGPAGRNARVVDSAAMNPIRIGLLGCGTVGGGVVQLLRANADYLAQSVGAPLEVVSVLIRDTEKERVPDLDRARLTTDPEAVLGDPSIDVFVEVMGGVNPARGDVERGTGARRSVVTPNEMLLGMHGAALVERAVSKGVAPASEGSARGRLHVVRV